MAQPDHVAIELIDDSLVLHIKNILDQLPFQLTNTNRQCPIVRVPARIREINKDFYEPRMVSIGPYHRGRNYLQCIEERKWCFVKQMLDINPYVTLNKYVELLKELESEARRCYYEEIHMNSHLFVMMLLRDACFIIQLIVNWSYQEEDIIYDISWNIPLIKDDLLMLENQIPFFVLQRVFDLYSSIDDANSANTSSNLDSMSQDSEHDKPSLSLLLVDFLKHGNETLPLPRAVQNFHHLLDFYYHCYMSTQKLPFKSRKRSSSLEMLRLKKGRHPQTNARRKPRMVLRATELKDAGITFKRAQSSSIFDVNFSNGVLRIPHTTVEEATRPRLMNLVAFEQCRGEKDKPLTSYAVFMDCIMNTPRDVLILQQHDILENKLADEKAAAKYFNQLRYGSYLEYEEHHLAELFENVKKYCDSSWGKYRVKLYRDYFSTPMVDHIISRCAYILVPS